MKNSLRITLFLYLCLAACNSTPQKQQPSDTLFANFYIRYLQPEKQVKAEASFFRGDSLKNAKPLSIEGGVVFQNSEMGNRTLPNNTIRYNYENFLDYPSEFIFQFKDLQNESQTQTLELPPLGAFSIENSVSKSNGGILKLENDTLSNEESLVFLISDDENHTTSFIIQAESGTQEFELPAKKLKKLTPGKVQLYLVRKMEKTVNEIGYSYTSVIEYYSNNYEFELVD